MDKVVPQDRDPTLGQGNTKQQTSNCALHICARCGMVLAPSSYIERLQQTLSNAQATGVRDYLIPLLESVESQQQFSNILLRPAYLTLPKQNDSHTKHHPRAGVALNLPQALFPRARVIVARS